MPTAAISAEQLRERHRSVERRQPAADEVAAGNRQIEHAHHQARDARRRQLRERAHADRAERQLAERVEQIRRRRASTARPCTPLLRELCGDDEDGEAGARRTSRPRANFAGLDGCRGAEPDPEPGEHRRERDDEQRLQRLELAARKLPAEDRCAVARSANRFSVDPACSNSDQNTVAARNSARIAYSRFRSTACPLAGEKQPDEEGDRQTERASTPAASAICVAVIGSSASVHPAGEQHDRGDRGAAPDRRAPLQLTRPRSGDAAGVGSSPASPRYLPPSTYCTRPSTMPMPATRKAQMPVDRAVRDSRRPAGAMKAPRLMPM